ncbi:MAG: MAPEG family protein [Pseudomonadota bacterium]
MLTGFYAAILALIFVGLSFRTLGIRRNKSIAIGDGGDERLQRAVRVHANFAEYVPIALILMLLMEASEAPPYWVHGAGLSLLVGRCLHAYGVSQTKENYLFRVSGMVLTFAVLISAATRLLFQAL